MINKETKDLFDKFTRGYSKEEFEFLISLFPYAKVTEIISKNEKKFRKYLQGYRPQKLPTKKLQEIYVESIFVTRNELIVKHVEYMFISYLKRFDEIITEYIGPVCLVREKIEQDQMEYFEKLVDLLIDHRFDELQKVIVYFKMIDYELLESQRNYLFNDLEKKVYYKKVKEEVTKTLSLSYEKSLRELSEEYETELKKYDVMINEYKQLSLHTDKKHKEVLILKENELLNVENKFKTATERIVELEKQVNEIIYVKNECEQIIHELSSAVNMKYDEYCATVEEKWMKSNVQLVQNKNDIQNTIDELLISKGDLLSEIVALNKQKSELENMISLLNDSGKGIVHNMQDFLCKIGFKHEVSAQVSRLYIIPSKSTELEEIEVINDKSFFIDDLAENLKICGISSEYANDLAIYLYASIVKKLSLLLIGYNSRKTANALSYLISGSTAEIITLPPGYDDCNEMISLVHSSTSKVILIENAIENISESVYLPLLKQNSDHILLFSIDSSEHIELLPSSLLNYMMLIDIDSLMGLTISNEEMLLAQSNPSIFSEAVVQYRNLESNFKHLRKLSSIYPLSQSAKVKIAEVMCVIDEQNSPNALYDIILFSLNLLCRCKGRSEELIEFVDHCDFSPMILKMLHAVIEEGQYYE
ncbi:hypothetical protein PAALTS15_00900 [Paenibacillus alvei TS-15]|uniref:Uncharacterized protein n=1 Tax=Paenibacillus alvei TS-15 TaxID=1117108 RepID=S9SX07_PAEAL|nr:hypothetical protein [Paenibacillus alvei]EPY09174.1 hypothetical protein PAALTS15_00900 [Paenibacillus alvei TS-15]